jgi:hypothetical protein
MSQTPNAPHDTPQPTDDNRRQADRLALPAGYTPVAVRTLGKNKKSYTGHAYDLSVGGVMFELDHGIDPGTAVSIAITLPASLGDAGRDVTVFGNVVWLDDSDVGPVRMAIAFTRFAQEGDDFRLHRVIANNLVRKAA